MNCANETMLLYAVTDRAWVGRQSLYQQVEAALQGGVTCVQLREKDLDEATFLEEAKALRALCRQYGVPFIINDNVQLALACGADGIHVGQEDMVANQVRARVGRDMLIGVSCHTLQEALEAVENGADYLGVGTMFATATKSDALPVTIDTLKTICQAVSVPVVAIGGIHEGNLMQLSGTGADGVALVSAIFAAEDIQAQCKKLRALAEEMVSQ